MKLRLPDSVCSSQDLTSLLLEIRDYGRWFYHNGIKQRTNTKHAVLPPFLSPAGLELVRSCSGARLLDQPSLDKLIEQLETYEKNAPYLTITLAAPPSGDVKQTLVAWCRTNIGPDVLVTFQFNATLLGGMVIRIGSHIFDWSFRRQILAARDRFPEVLRSV
ncbi:MAG: F0F1 ATP synthase subunit delta [Candidatus Saccharibacteria bacterium]